VENVPVESIKNYPRKSLFIFGVIAYSVILGLWIYFFIVGYEAELRSTYISFDKSAGVCNEVALPITGVFLASRDAKWEGICNTLKQTSSIAYLKTFLNDHLKIFCAISLILFCGKEMPSSCTLMLFISTSLMIYR
jgi:hypothetical protein